MKRLVTFGVVVAGTAVLTLHGRAAGPAVIKFDDLTVKAGVQMLHHTRRFNGPSADVLRMFTSGGAAVAAADFDNDGFDDLFVTDSAEGTTSRLYHNNGNLTFTDVTARAGVGGGNDASSIVADALIFSAQASSRALAVSRLRSESFMGLNARAIRWW